MTTAPTVSEILADWIVEMDLANVPNDAIAGCANTIIDTIGLSVAALDTDYGQSVRKAFDDRGTATVFGIGQGFAPESAAAINGTCGHGEDYDNTFEGCPVHSGVVIVPALMAAGQRYNLPAAAVAKGIVVGIEVMCRLGLVADKYVHKAGFHPTGILGAMRLRPVLGLPWAKHGRSCVIRWVSQARPHRALLNIWQMALRPSAYTPVGLHKQACGRQPWGLPDFPGPLPFLKVCMGYFTALPTANLISRR